jgi:adenosine kinase
MDFPGRFADHILPEKIHILNVCFLVNGLEEKFGGTAGNIAYSLALLGERPLIVATAGRDFDRYEERLRQHGLPLTGIRRVEEELTAGAYITTDQADNQITGFNPGAMKHPARFQLDGFDPSQALAIVAAGNLEDMETYSRAFREAGIPYICDPGQNIPAFSGDQLLGMISGSAVLISNDYELEMIGKKTGLDKPGLLERTKAIITTLGDKGSVVATAEKEVSIPAVRAARVLDPTGAGDAYRAGLIKGLVAGQSLEEAARVGATCASFAVEHHGTQEHRFTENEFWQRHRGHFG